MAKADETENSVMADYRRRHMRDVEIGRPHRDRVMRWTGRVLFIALFAGLAFLGVRRYLRMERAKVRAEEVALQTARGEKAETYRLFSDKLVRLQELDAEVGDIARAASNDLQVLEGARAEVASLPPDDTEASGVDMAAESSTGDAADGGDDTDLEVPQGMMTPAQLRRYQEGKAAPDEDPGPKPDSPAAPARTDRAQVASVGATSAQTAATEIFEARGKVHANLSAAVRLRVKMDKLLSEGERLRTSGGMQDLVKDMKGHLGEIKKLVLGAETLTGNARTRSAEVNGIRERVEAERVAARERALHLEQVEADRATFNAAWDECRELLKENRYQETGNLVEEAFGRCSTKEGKADFESLREQYARISALYEYLIEMLNKEPFGWGWTQTKPVVDVLGADRNVVRIRGAEVPWTGVGQRQLYKFLDHYVMIPASRSRRMDKYCVASAILFSELGRAELAELFANKALEIKPSLADDINRLVISR